MTRRGARRIALWGTSALVLAVYYGCSGGDVDRPDPDIPSVFKVESSFGQLLAGDTAAHYVTIEVTPSPTWPAPGSGTIRYVPKLGSLERCLVFRPRQKEVTDFVILNEILLHTTSNGMPDGRNVRIAFCNFKASELDANIQALFDHHFSVAGITTGNAALERAAFLDGTASRDLDIYRRSPDDDDSMLGETESGRLQVTALLGTNLSPPTFLNPEPYLAPFLKRFVSRIADAFNSQEPRIDTFVVEAASDPAFTSHVDYTLLHDAAATETVAGLVRFRLKLEEESSASAQGPTIAPSYVDYRLNLVTRSGGSVSSRQLKSSGRWRMKSLEWAQGRTIGRAIYDHGRSDVTANRLWMWVPFGTRGAAVDTSARNFSVSALPLAFDLDAMSGAVRAYPAGEYELAVTVSDPFSYGRTTAGKTHRGYFNIAAGSVPLVTATTDRYKNYDWLTAASTWTVHYQVVGITAFDRIRWKLFRGPTQVGTGTEMTGSATGSFTIPVDPGGTILTPDFYDLELEAMQGATSKGIGPRYRLTVYRMTAKRPGAGAVFNRTAPGIYVLRNDDDDNSNGTDDSTEGFGAEDDLVPVEIRFEPLISGTFSIASSAGTPFKLWTSNTKAAAWALPKKLVVPASPPPWTVHVEGVTAGAHELRLTHLTTGGVALTSTAYAMSIVGFDLVNATAGTMNFARIGNWEHGYTAAPAVRNGADGSATGNFVNRDDRRFFVRVTDPVRNTNAGTRQSFVVRVGTLLAGGGLDDNLTDVTVTETLVNSGIFESVTQLLTSHDTINDGGAALDPDDKFNVHTGPAAGGTVGDDTAGDRTHTAEIDGSVRVTYQPAGYPGVSFDVSLPVCERVLPRSEHSRLVADLRIHIYNEPFDDVGFDHDGLAATPITSAGNGRFDWTDTDADNAHDVGERSEPYRDFRPGGFFTVYRRGTDAGVTGGRGPLSTDAEIDRHIARTDLAWAQACIKTNRLSRAFEDAPRPGGTDILDDGSVDDVTETLDIYTAHSAGMTTTAVDVFYVGDYNGGNAIQYRPGHTTIAHGEHSFLVLDSQLPVEWRTLGHELGHVLLNQAHAAGIDPEFFPNGPPVGAGFNDSIITTYRRLFLPADQRARVIRPLGAGHIHDPGNSVLRNP